MRTLIQKLKKMILVLLALVAGGMLLLFLLLLLYSPGKPAPLKDKNGKPPAGSISEKVFVEIGGVRQGMFIRGKSLNNPVLLYLHGGMPDYFLTPRYPVVLEEYFTVVWWEQRWAGMSYHPGTRPEAITPEQLISDTRELTNYLRGRFGQEKIYLLGRSGGSFFGIQAAARFPELYHAYIGIGQMSDQLHSERLAYQYMLDSYRLAGDVGMVRRLEACPVTNHIPAAYLRVRDQAMHRIGVGTTRAMRSVVSGMFIPSLTFKEYTLKEKFNLWRGKAAAGVHPLWESILATDLSRQVNRAEIPVYFLHGRYDYTVSYTLAKGYFEVFQAPEKAFFTFEHSAHSPHFEEPERVREVLERILKGRVNE